MIKFIFGDVIWIKLKKQLKKLGYPTGDRHDMLTSPIAFSGGYENKGIGYRRLRNTDDGEGPERQRCGYD